MSNNERTESGYVNLGIEGYEVKTEYEPKKEQSSSTNQSSSDPHSFLIMGPDSRVK